jgi:hypothetical protein
MVNVPPIHHAHVPSMVCFVVAGSHCLVLSCLVIALPCLTLPCLALSWLGLAWFVFPCLALPYLGLSCIALPWLGLSCLALPCLALACLALSCLALACLVLSCLDLALGTPLSVKALEAQLHRVVEMSNRKMNENPTPDNEAIGALTTGDRDEWATVRNGMLTSSVNKATLKTIESSLFHVALDHWDTHTMNEKVRNGLHGDCKNRWFDKALSVVASKNGDVGMYFEHAWGDGISVLRWTHDTGEMILNNQYEVILTLTLAPTLTPTRNRRNP